MVDSLQVNNEMWNRNVDLLNMISYGQLTLFAADMRRSLRQMLAACNVILFTIGPMYVQKVPREVDNKDGSTRTVLDTKYGIRTQLFIDRKQLLTHSNNWLLASEHPHVDRATRHAAAQKTYELLYELSLQLLQDIEDMGLNKREKMPGYGAALTGA